MLKKVQESFENPDGFKIYDGCLTNKPCLLGIFPRIEKDKAWTGECNQLDVYTTILDIMGIESEWRGLGHTLLNSNYKNSVNDGIQGLSDWIIYGNYFNQKEIE